jgi:hypothetical protein
MYRAMSWLPTSEATIERDESGKLFITWLSPCVEIGRFTIAIRSREIMLGCEISHTHFDITRYLSRVRITNMGLKRRIIRDSIEEAALFLQGGIAASISYDATGKRHGSGWCRVCVRGAGRARSLLMLLWRRSMNRQCEAKSHVALLLNPRASAHICQRQ